MKQLNEVARMQQLAGIGLIKEEIENQSKKKIHIKRNLDEGGFSFHSFNTKWIEDKLDKSISAYCDVYKNYFVIWGLYDDEVEKLKSIFTQENLNPILLTYRRDKAFKLSNEYLDKQI
jgi:hypothetical protein